MYKLSMFVLIFVIAFAVPIHCEEGRKKLAVEKAFEELWRQTCRNVSGIEVDFERNDRLHREYEKCRNDAINPIEYQQDVKEIFPNLSDDFTTSTFIMLKTNLSPIAQKYCPKIHTYINCKEKKSIIYDECFTTDERKGITLNDEIFLRVKDFFCDNNAERVTQFIDANFTECLIAKRTELLVCYEKYAISLLDPSNTYTNILLALFPRPEGLCKSTQNLKKCVLSVMDECEGEIINSLFTYIDIDTICADFQNGTYTATT